MCIWLLTVLFLALHIIPNIVNYFTQLNDTPYFPHLHHNILITHIHTALFKKTGIIQLKLVKFLHFHRYPKTLILLNIKKNRLIKIFYMKTRHFIVNLILVNNAMINANNIRVICKLILKWVL